MITRIFYSLLLFNAGFIAGVCWHPYLRRRFYAFCCFIHLLTVVLLDLLMQLWLDIEGVCKRAFRLLSGKPSS